jgi:glutathione synthase/RimK-type ligase-like ATP-grasp enzyme
VRIALATAADQVPTDQDDAPLLAALVGAGHDAALVAWDDPTVAWETFGAVLIRTTWDYHTRREAFVAWAAEVEARTRLFNPAEVVRWNTHKGYLLELEERGAPIVPTAWLAQGDQVDLAALAAARGWSEVVLKPAVGAGGAGIARLRPQDGQATLDALAAAGDAMVQPYVPTIATAGELSVILFDGEVSHAVRKVPADGGLLVQIEHGGTYEPLPEVPAEAAALARWVVEAAGHDLLFARVDLLTDEVGGWLVNELEVTEPGLFMHLIPGSAERLVAALEDRVAPEEGSRGE